MRTHTHTLKPTHVPALEELKSFSDLSYFSNSLDPQTKPRWLWELQSMCWQVPGRWHFWLWDNKAIREESPSWEGLGGYTGQRKETPLTLMSCKNSTGMSISGNHLPHRHPQSWCVFHVRCIQTIHQCVIPIASVLIFVPKLIHFSKILKDPIGPQLPWWHRIAERTMALEKCSLEHEGKVMNIGFPLSYVLIFINLLPLFTKEVFLYYKMSKIL